MNEKINLEDTINSLYENKEGLLSLSDKKQEVKPQDLILLKNISNDINKMYIKLQKDYECIQSER